MCVFFLNYEMQIKKYFYMEKQELSSLNFGDPIMIFFEVFIFCFCFKFKWEDVGNSWISLSS